MQRKHTSISVSWEHVQNIQVFFLIYKTTVINLTLFPCNVAKNKVNRYGVNKTEKFVFPSCLGLLYNHHQKQHHLQFVR